MLKSHFNKLNALCLLAVLVFILSGCTRVKPWERQYLALNEMSLNPEPLNKTYRNHIYYSREGTNGEVSTVGSGCGCN